MKKALLITAVTLVCLVLTGTMIITALSLPEAPTATSASAANGFVPSVQPLADENSTQTPTFDTSTPLFIYDFTTETPTQSFANTFNMTYTVVEGEYTTFTATADDPYTWIQTPTIKACEAKYAVITYRTTADKMGEFFCSRSDGVQMGQAGSNQQWKWVASGEWETITVPCEVWSNASQNVSFDVFRFDPLQANVMSNQSIDIRYIAFFSDPTEALNFDLKEYQAKLAYEEESKRAEEEADKNVDWPDPEFVEMETSADDLNEGTLTYIPSADGSTMTIEYVINGEKVSYTVPNSLNYISGGYAATDDLDRSLYDSAEVGMYGSNGERYVGLFYFLWHGEHGDSGIFDLQKIIDQFGDDATNLNHYGPEGAMHWFAEPLYGYYYANDEWVMQKHAELLCNANIDFLYLDVTNGYTYRHNATKLMKILHELNEQGYDAPQVVFYTNSNAATVVADLYNNIYKQGLYEDTWFCIDGKPVIVAPYETNINDFFHIKVNQWPNEASKTNGWPWMDFSWPSRVFYDESGSNGAISVSIAQHSGSVCFSTSSLYNDRTNRGRSFNAPNGVVYEYGTNRPANYNTALGNSYRTWLSDKSLTDQGLNFQQQWDHAIASDAKYVLVTGWNEWVAQRQAGDRVLFVDTASMEYSRDAEMMRGGYFDNYYIQLIYNTQKLKGTAPIVVQDSRKPINITAGFEQWDDVTVTYSDVEGDTIERDAIGFGKTPYKDDSGRNDIVASKITGDTKNVYFYVETVDDISMFDNKSTWMQLFINIDRDNTGWYGYDYIVNYSAKDAFTTTVAKYNGTEGEYSFEIVGEISYRAKDNQMMIAVPQEMLGIEGYLEIDFEFKWADSDTVINTMEQFYTDGDVAPLGRLNYIYRNYIDGESQIVYPGQNGTSETTAIPQTTAASVETDEPGTSAIVTDTVASIDTTIAPVDTNEPADSTTGNTDANKTTANDGCASIVASGTLVSVMAILTFTGICLKKKD